MRCNVGIRSWYASLMTGLVSLAIATGVMPAVAKDFFVVIGGGFSPESNQASLEANLIFFQNVLTEKGLKEARQFYYFADGDDGVDDLQVVAPKQKSEHDLVKLMRGFIVKTSTRWNIEITESLMSRAEAAPKTLKSV